MNSPSLYRCLEAANEKPTAFSVYTARDLWTDAHTSAQMLSFHLNENVDVSSRRGSFIDASTEWMTQRFKLGRHSRIVDFGCGPGLYTARFARLQADTVGIDFSPRSIEHARTVASRHGLEVTYVEADYLQYDPTGPFDLIIMIMCDFCALAPSQRATMLNKFKHLLADDGRVVLDAYSMAAFAGRTEASFYEKNQLNGFWSAQPYYAFVSSFRYEAERVSLDKYTIVEEGRSREVYNWLQYFSPETLGREAEAAGLHIETLLGDVAGGTYRTDAEEFAVVMKHDT